MILKFQKLRINIYRIIKCMFLLDLKKVYVVFIIIIQKKKIKEYLLNNKQYENYIIVGKRLSRKILKLFNSDATFIYNFKRNLFEETYKIIINKAISKNINEIIFIYTLSKTLFFNEIKEESINLDLPFIDKKNFFKNDYEESKLIYIFHEKYNKYKIMKIFFESLISEQSFRFIAMDKASNNAEKKAFEIKTIYNKKRQENITKELLIFSNLIN